MTRFLPFLIGLWLTAPAAGLDLDDPASAVETLESLVAEWEAEWERQADADSAVGLATSLQALGVIRRQLGDPRAAAEALERACELLRQHAPGFLPDALEAHALALLDLGDHAGAEELLREVLVARRLDSADPVSLALTLDHLAQALLLRGDYLEVAPMLEESLALLPEARPLEKARIIGHLGRLRHTLGSHARAVRRFDEALALDFDDPELRLSLRSQKALALLRLGETDEAVRQAEAVADDARELLVRSPLRAVPYINNLGTLSLSLGRPDEAVAAFREAIGLLVGNFGEDHPTLAGARHNLGVALQQTGALGEAETELRAAAELQRRYLPESHLRAAQTHRDLAINAILSGSPEAARLAREATARGLDLLERLVESGTETERLNFIGRFDLLSLPCALGDAELIADTLLASKARLLDALIGGSGSASPDWMEVSRALPAGSAFIDLCRFRPLEPDAPDRYGAILLVAGGRPAWIELGSAESLNRWLAAMGERLNWNAARLSGETSQPPALTLSGTLRALHEQFWAPIETRIPPEIRHLAIAPDAASHFLPLPALIDADNRLLCRRYAQITRVASGRDLLDSRPLPPLDSRPWAVLTIADYPPPPDGASADTPLGAMLAQLGPLPGTAEEARILRRVAPAGSSFLQDAGVSESALRGLSESPAVLHFGGHAFFLGGGRRDGELPLDFDLHADQLLASGLVLHRGIANAPVAPRSDPADDLLFPGEIARLPLGDTRLVILSSCDSGVGTSVDGEGILGLQRAFAVAGARETVVALWPVSDRSTPEIMRRFYDLALHSDRPAQALWQAQSEFLPPPDDPGFEEAVLRFAPFALNQTQTLRPGPEIRFKSSGSFPWWSFFATLPILFFAAARWIGHRRKGCKINKI